MRCCSIVCLAALLLAAHLGRAVAAPPRTIVNSLGMKFVELPSGQFAMGASSVMLAMTNSPPTRFVSLAPSSWVFSRSHKKTFAR